MIHVEGFSTLTPPWRDASFSLEALHGWFMVVKRHVPGSKLPVLSTDAQVTWDWLLTQGMPTNVEFPGSPAEACLLRERFLLHQLSYPETDAIGTRYVDWEGTQEQRTVLENRLYGTAFQLLGRELNRQDECHGTVIAVKRACYRLDFVLSRHASETYSSWEGVGWGLLWQDFPLWLHRWGVTWI